MLDVQFRSAKQLAADIKRRKIGCLELLDLYLARVEKYDGALNAVVVRDFDRARTRARAADRALARRQLWGPLHGVPMTIKESYDVVGLPTTWGVPAYQDRIATTNAVVVDRLLRAGVVLFGKTNVPPLLGRLHRRVVPAVECRTLRVHAEPAPGGRADRRPTVRRSRVSGLRAPARARVPAFRAATRLRVSGKHRAAPPG
jgi:hypothetical protein